MRNRSNNIQMNQTRCTCCRMNKTGDQNVIELFDLIVVHSKTNRC